MKKAKKSVWITVLVIAVVVLIGGALFLIKYFTDDYNPITRGDITVTSEPGGEGETTSSSGGSGSPDGESTPDEPVYKFGYKMDEFEEWVTLSFDELTEINPDIFAWIYIPGTNVDYPVARSAYDDSYYLNRNVFGEYQFAGTIFAQLMNRTDMQDPVTVFYGHNMLNGSMFATLHRFSDPDFFDEHTTCFVTTKDGLYTYLIYAAYVYDNRHIMNSVNFLDPDTVKEYIKSTMDPRTARGLVREGVELDEDSRILTLSTCTGSSSSRFLVQGVLVDEQLR